ncbi:MAG: protein kinase [Rhodobacterales bacterium]|nr:protein kinase [Rhodobacterales bacterium]
MQPGDRIDEWKIDRVLGTGDTASVYACHRVGADDALVAIRVLDEAALRMPGARDRLAREAKLLFNLDHPGLVGMREVRSEATPPYLVMDLVQGRTLRARMDEGDLSFEEAVGICERLTESVAYLHQRGIQHRDLKPANVLLRDGGGLCLVNFGLVLEEGANRMTADGVRMETVSYVPPECDVSAATDAVKWDVYALGVMFWELLVGRAAFPMHANEDPLAAALRVVAAKRSHPPLDPGAGMPLYLRALIRDMTHLQPKQRPDDAHTVLFRMQTATPADHLTAMETLDWPGLTPGGVQTLDEIFCPEDLTEHERKRLAVGEFAVARWERFAGPALFAFFTLGVLFLAGILGWTFGQNADRSPSLVVSPPPREATFDTRARVDTKSVQQEQMPGTAAATTRTPKSTEPVTERAPAAVIQVGLPVTIDSFKIWMSAHPEWKKAVAIAEGRANDGYLANWDAKAANGPATSVSWVAAAAYCRARGALAPLSAAPERWAIGPNQPHQEWRVKAGRAAWRTSDGRDHTGVDEKSTSELTGFRCAKP